MITLFFDTETTGFPTPEYTPSLIQIGAILQDDTENRVVAELSLIISTREPIPPHATEIHGITDEMIAAYGVNSSLAEILFTDLIMKADLLVAHNIAFDLSILEGAWPHAYAVAKGKQQFDTMHELTPIMKLPKNGENHYHDEKYPDYKAPRLTEAYEHYYGKQFENAHDALADTRALRDVYLAMPKDDHARG